MILSICLGIIEGLIDYVLENRDVTAIIDANPILQDLRRFFTHGKYCVSNGNVYDA